MHSLEIELSMVDGQMNLVFRRLVSVRFRLLGIASAVKTLVMGIRVVVRDGESIKQALSRLRREMQDACVFEELMIHLEFESHGAKRRMKQRLAKQRAQDLVIWERLQRKF